MERYLINGIYVNSLDYSKLISTVKDFFKDNKTKLIFTPNPEIIYNSQKDKHLKDIINSSDINLPDGIGVLIAARINKYPIRERITGIDSFTCICREKVGRIFLLGSAPGIAEKAKVNLEKMFSGIDIVGTHDGYFGNDKEIVDLINKSNADILFVGLGSPRQEIWLYNNRSNLNVKVAMAIGGSLDVISGEKKRAPGMFIKFNIEWLYRLAQEPWRIKRMIVLPKFIFNTLINVVKKNNLG